MTNDKWAGELVRGICHLSSVICHLSSVIGHWSFSRRMLILPRPCFEAAKTTGSGRVYGNTSALAVALALRANPLYCRQRKVNDSTLFGGHGLQTQRFLLRQHLLGRHLGQKDKFRFSVLSIIIRI